ncbi:MAG: hypothetical protein WAT39_00475 [Planctomycetota bacterium]
MEVLLDRPDLAIAYEAHATESDRGARKSNRFHVTRNQINAAIKDPDPNYPVHKLTPLQRVLRERGQFGFLDAGPHAGMLHAAMGFSGEGNFGFFDPHSWQTVLFAFRCCWESFQLCDALVPKLMWIDGATWDASATNIQSQARVIEKVINDRNHWKGPLAPWSSFHPLPSKRPPL